MCPAPRLPPEGRGDIRVPDESPRQNRSHQDISAGASSVLSITEVTAGLSESLSRKSLTAHALTRL